jgi:alkylhydroperoxidase family enzyme
VYTTIVRVPDLADKMVTYGRALRGDNLSLRHRETLILRTGWNCQSNYEFAQHRRLATEGGMTDADIQRIIDGPDVDGWDPFERLLCQAADELHAQCTISDSVWAGLAAEYDEEQLIQATMLIGYYHLVSFILNAFVTPLEPGQMGFR